MDPEDMRRLWNLSPLPNRLGQNSTAVCPPGSQSSAQPGNVLSRRVERCFVDGFEENSIALTSGQMAKIQEFASVLNEIVSARGEVSISGYGDEQEIANDSDLGFKRAEAVRSALSQQVTNQDVIVNIQVRRLSGDVSVGGREVVISRRAGEFELDRPFSAERRYGCIPQLVGPRQLGNSGLVHPPVDLRPRPEVQERETVINRSIMDAANSAPSSSESTTGSETGIRMTMEGEIGGTMGRGGVAVDHAYLGAGVSIPIGGNGEPGEAVQRSEEEGRETRRRQRLQQRPEHGQVRH